MHMRSRRSSLLLHWNAFRLLLRALRLLLMAKLAAEGSNDPLIVLLRLCYHGIHFRIQCRQLRLR